MQASLKLNTTHSDFILLTISSLQPNTASPPETNDFLQNSDVTHSRMTELSYQRNTDVVREERSQEQEVKECATCAVWKRWAAQQEKEMLCLQQHIAQKQMMLERNIAELTSALSQKTKTIQQYTHQLENSKATVTALIQQISRLDNQKESENDRTRKDHNSPPQPTAFATPLKTEPTSQRLQAQRFNCSTKLSQMLTDQKKGRTCATGKQLQWSAFETNLKQNDSKLMRGLPLDKCLFQNTMLKEYNAVLLERLRESKYRKAL